jgi:DNA-binding transcriptional LysR family regulator
VHITTLHSLTYTWLQPRLPQFAAQHPNVRLTVDTEVALTRFDDGGPDLGIRHGAGHWPGLTAHHLMDDHPVPGGVAHPARRGRRARRRRDHALAAGVRPRPPGLARLAARGRRAWRFDRGTLPLQRQHGRP